ncbi:MAG TPA: TRAP transporter substrate-binding protein DctP [Elusimicrobiota bacterium]|jgi:TRAP-type C4-dicarboxylate transport system substrate-binding protein|nr:TRAP transporter substrate-binding protein DctP [Elusimicrobiota bacterium]
MTTSKLALALAALFLGAAARAQDVKYIKFATLAPEGSTWMNVMTDLSKDLEKATGGKLKFKFYPGGTEGEDKDVVKKIRIGELQAGGFTGVGLGEIAPEVRLLDAPWLFRNRRELQEVREKFAKTLDAAVEKGGFVVLGWTDLGSVYVFSKDPISGPDDMKKAKMWVWEGDPIAEAAYKALGVDPIPLSVVDVMQSLQTGLIDAVYGPPLGVVALQWFQRLKHIYPVPMAESTGAVLISKKFFDALPADQRRALVDLSAEHLKRLNELSDADNDTALASLQKQGLILGPEPGPAVMRRYAALGRAARRDLTGRLFDAKLLDQVEKELAALRARKTAKR